MSARYLLDTNILSEALRNPFGELTARMSEFNTGRIATSSIVASEMRYGAAKQGSVQLTDRVEKMLALIEVLPFDDAASHHFADIRKDLERRGCPIGWGDFFIAAHARALDMTLVTDNIREFSRVDGLKLENWIDREPSHG